jgi:hypothetical protein
VRAVLDGLFVTAAATAVAEALASARADGAIAVVGHAKLAAALANPERPRVMEPGAPAERTARTVTPVALPKRAAKKVANALADLSSVEAGSLDAVIGVGAASGDAWEATLAAWSRVVRDGGAVVMVDRARAAEASRRALCAGLSELEQRAVGRVVVTSGLVTHLSFDRS